VSTFFSDQFEIDASVVDDYGAFDISLIGDLPLFIDPFLLFNSDKPEYKRLHDELIRYLVFLRDKAKRGPVNEGLLRAWYCFPEVKQTWLGFSLEGNEGRGLGIDFARSLHENLHQIFDEFGTEKITKGSHIEKVCLIKDGIGRDNISDFVTNLIKDFLCTYTQEFAQQALRPEQRRSIAINGAVFNYETETWQSKTYSLPWANDDFVILTPKDMLTRDETWINRRDLIRGFEEIPTGVVIRKLCLNGGLVFVQFDLDIIKRGRNKIDVVSRIFLMLIFIPKMPSSANRNRRSASIKRPPLTVSEVVAVVAQWDCASKTIPDVICLKD
jgi:hypothetical protein